MIIHRHLQRLLQRSGLTPDSPPDAQAWKAFLRQVGESCRLSEEERYRLERSLQTHTREVQTLYQQLLCERERLDTVLASLDYGLVLVDAQGLVVLANGQAEMWLGRGELPLLGRPVPPELSLPLQEAFSGPVLVGARSIHLELEPVTHGEAQVGTILSLRESADPWAAIRHYAQAAVQQAGNPEECSRAQAVLDLVDGRGEVTREEMPPITVEVDKGMAQAPAGHGGPIAPARAAGSAAGDAAAQERPHGPGVAPAPVARQEEAEGRESTRPAQERAGAHGPPGAAPTPVARQEEARRAQAQAGKTAGSAPGPPRSARRLSVVESAPLPPEAPLSVLVVGRAPERASLQEMVERQGHQCLAVEDPNRALALLRHHEADVVVAASLELCRRLRQNGSAAYFILQAEHPLDGDEARQAGVDAVTKPPMPAADLAAHLQVARGVRSRRAG